MIVKGYTVSQEGDNDGKEHKGSHADVCSFSVTEDLALAEATTEFKDGRTFMECADATPTNVGAKVKAHFARMALTRAKARGLRDALNIAMCSVEEMAE